MPARLAFIAVLASLFGVAPARLSAQTGQDVAGVILDAETRDGVPDVVVEVRGTDISALSDDEGRFVLRNISAGSWTLDVTHIRYGVQSHDIVLAEGVRISLEIRLAVDAIELSPLVVQGETTVEREARTTGASFWEVTREEFEEAVHTSQHMGDVLRRTIPGLKLRQSTNMSRNDICLEFRAAASISIINSRPCNHPKVLLDGVPVADPQYLYGAVPLSDLERIQVIPPGEASTRYGSGSLYGVVLIETRRPGLRPNEREAVGAGSGLTTFDWELDPAGHHTGKVFLGATVGNLLGLAGGAFLLQQCFSMDGPEIRGECGGFSNTLAGATAVALPMLGAALGARLAGSTDLSRGSFLPSMVGAGLIVFPGVVLSLSEAADSSDAVATAGAVLLAVGVPAAVTLADKLYRQIR